MNLTWFAAGIFLIMSVNHIDVQGLGTIAALLGGLTIILIGVLD